MRQLRITERGWETYTGLLGRIMFENGLSVGPVTDMDMERVGAVVSVVDAGTNRQVGAAQSVNDTYNSPAPVVEPMKVSEGTGGEGASEEQVAPNAKRVKIWTEQELYEVADKGGINAVREIAEPMKVKAVAIRDLVKRIVAHQAVQLAKGEIAPETKENPAEPEPSPEEVVVEGEEVDAVTQAEEV